MAKYYVTVDGSENRIYESDKMNEAIKVAKAEVEKPRIKKAYVHKEGDSTFTRSYTPKPYTAHRVKHAHLIKDEQGRICGDMKSQNKQRDTSARYCFEDNTLVIAGKTIEKHPKFKNIEKFEDWVNCYFADGKDGYDAEG